MCVHCVLQLEMYCRYLH